MSGLTVDFRINARDVEVALEVPEGGRLAVIGPNAAGKSTVLQVAAGLLVADRGQVRLDGHVLTDTEQGIEVPPHKRRIGLMAQSGLLFKHLNVLDNVALLPMLAGKTNEFSRQRAMELLTTLEVEHRAHAKPSQLSGGEQQRVAIARAMANQPPFILADEPTAPLDSERSLIVMKLLARLAQQFNTAIMVVTHDDIIIPRFKRLYRLRDGVAHEEAGQGLPFPE